MIFDTALLPRVLKLLTTCFAVLTFSGCASSADGQSIHLETLARSQNCDVPSSEPYWLRVDNHSDLPAAFAAVNNNGPFWLVGLGNKPTGGYSINVASKAIIAGSELRINTITTSPEGRIVSQAFTNPCVLLAAPAGYDITTSRWLENGNAQIVTVQPYRASEMRQHWQ